MRAKLNDIGFYKDMYSNELVRKTEIDNSIGFPSTLLTILIGSGLYLFKYASMNTLVQRLICHKIILIFIGILFIISICFSIIFLMKLYANNLQKYKYLPSPESLLKRENELYNHYYTFYESVEKTNAEDLASKDSKHAFEEDLLNYYIVFATNNQLLNDIRTIDLYRARRLLIISIIFMGIFGLIVTI